MAVDFRTAQPRDYYRKFLEQNVRPDGRELGEIRPTTLNIGSISTASGSALVKIGNTTVICGVKAELATPKEEEPKRGYLVPNVDLPPLCSPNFRPGPPSQQAQVACQFMDQVIKSANCVHLEDLCILEQKFVWVLYCDLICLDYDGNLLDACVLATFAALKNVELPRVTVDEETEMPQIFPDELKPLPIHSQPFATSFTIFDNHILCADPTGEEESLATGALTIVTLQDGSICHMHKPGGSGLSEEKLQQCVDRAHERSKELNRLVSYETLLSVER